MELGQNTVSDTIKRLGRLLVGWASRPDRLQARVMVPSPAGRMALGLAGWAR